MSYNHPNLNKDSPINGINQYKIDTIRKNIINFQQYVKAMRLNEAEIIMTQELLMALILGIANNNTMKLEERQKFTTRLMNQINAEIRK